MGQPAGKITILKQLLYIDKVILLFLSVFCIGVSFEFNFKYFSQSVHVLLLLLLLHYPEVIQHNLCNTILSIVIVFIRGVHK